jgi:putative ABC transport system permease protein
VRAVLPATVNPEQPSKVLVTLPSDALTAKRATERTFSVLFSASPWSRCWWAASAWPTRW